MRPPRCVFTGVSFKVSVDSRRFHWRETVSFRQTSTAPRATRDTPLIVGRPRQTIAACPPRSHSTGNERLVVENLLIIACNRQHVQKRRTATRHSPIGDLQEDMQEAFGELMLEGMVPLQGELLQQSLRPSERAYLKTRTPHALAHHEIALGLRDRDTIALGPARPGRPAMLNGRTLPCWIEPYGSYAANSSDTCSKPGKRATRRGSLLTRWSAVVRDEKRGHAPPLARMLRRVGRLLFVGDSIVEQMAAAAMCELLRSGVPEESMLISRISYFPMHTPSRGSKGLDGLAAQLTRWSRSGGGMLLTSIGGHLC